MRVEAVTRLDVLVEPFSGVAPFVGDHAAFARAALPALTQRPKSNSALPPKVDILNHLSVAHQAWGTWAAAIPDDTIHWMVRYPISAVEMIS